MTSTDINVLTEQIKQLSIQMKESHQRLRDDIKDLKKEIKVLDDKHDTVVNQTTENTTRIKAIEHSTEKCQTDCATKEFTNQAVTSGKQSNRIWIMTAVISALVSVVFTLGGIAYSNITGEVKNDKPYNQPYNHKPLRGKNTTRKETVS